MTTEVSKPLSRSEREALIKDKAGWVITILAALLAINTLVGGSNSSKIMNNTIAENNLWAWYQAKNIRQVLVDFEADAATERGNATRAKELRDWSVKLESDPKTGEGKKELAAKASVLAAEKDEARAKSPFFTYAGSLLQIAIVLLTASILAVNNRLFVGSIIVGGIAIVLMSHALWLWISILL